MKAIKLASIFAVTAVAAAVSTTTLAAEGVFSGQAGLKFVDTKATNGKSWNSEGEVNLNIDTGVVSSLIEFRGATATIVTAVVKQGAVSFGDFDGSISDDAVIKASRVIEGEYSDGSKTDIGVRYDVAPGLKVALEMKTASDGVGVAAYYKADLGMATVSVSAGSYAGETAGVADEVTNYGLGLSVPAGAATLIASYGAGETTSGTTKKDVAIMNVGASFQVSDAFKVGLHHAIDDENSMDNTEIAAWYTAGDVTYYVANMTDRKSVV